MYASITTLSTALGRPVGQQVHSNRSARVAGPVAGAGLLGPSPFLGRLQVKAHQRPERGRNASGLTVMALQVGGSLPSATVQNDKGETLILGDIARDTACVIFFYPRADTSGCTRQACGFRDIYDEFKAAGYAVYGMSADAPEAQAAWKAKMMFQYPLLSDPSFAALKALGVDKTKDTGALSINRSHIVVAKGGKIVAIELGVTPEESVQRAKDLILPAKM